VTGKGVRWGRDSVGRSAPAFRAASTPALPPTYLHGKRPTSSAAVVFAARPANCGVLRPVPGGESAGCVCPAVPVLRAFACLPFCLPCPLPFISSCPRSFAPFILLAPVHFAPLCFATCSLPCAPGSSVRASSCCQGQHVCKLRTVPLAAATRACSGGPCTGPFDYFLFSAESMILGHGLV